MEPEKGFSINWSILFGFVWAASGLFIAYLLAFMTSPYYAFHALYCGDVLLALLAHAALSVCFVGWLAWTKASRKSLRSLFVLTTIVAVPFH